MCYFANMQISLYPANTNICITIAQRRPNVSGVGSHFDLETLVKVHSHLIEKRQYDKKYNKKPINFNM